MAIAACRTSGSSTTCRRIEDASASYAANANFLGTFSNVFMQFLGLRSMHARRWSLVRCDSSWSAACTPPTSSSDVSAPTMVSDGSTSSPWVSVRSSMSMHSFVARSHMSSSR